jgi:predicted negative regulator of RcsB-dependent stress response
VKKMNWGTIALIAVGGVVAYKVYQSMTAPAAGAASAAASAAPNLQQTAQAALNQSAAQLIKQAQDAVSSIGVSGMC